MQQYRHAASQNLDRGTDVIKKVTTHVESHGVADMDKLMQVISDGLNEFERTDINLAITGQTGAGKSSLINCLRNVKADEDAAARVGCTETTSQVTPYFHPDMPKIVLWDLPGVNTPNFRQADYEEKVGIGRFDAIIICTATRFLESDLWFAQRAHQRKIPYYCVRTKIDIDVANDEEDSGDRHNEGMLLHSMRHEIQSQMQKVGLPHDKVYLISTRIRHQTKWEFNNLQRELVENAPAKNRTALILALVAGSEQCIEDKKREFEQRIDAVASQAADNEGKEIQVLQSEITQYRKRFGITEKNLQKWDVKISNLKKELKDISQNLDNLDELLKDRIKDLNEMTNFNSSQQNTVPSGIADIPVIGPIACIIGSLLDMTMQSQRKKQKQEAISNAEKGLEKAQKMRENAVKDAAEKRREAVLKYSTDCLVESLNHYAELAKGILQARQKKLM